MAGQRASQLTIALFLLFPLSNALAQDQRGVGYFDHMEWRHIGPAVFGGRIPDVEAVPENPAVIYVAGSTGGIFKTTNNGVTWRPIFDHAGPTLSIGDMAIAPSDPLIIWVGTGESNGEQQAGSLGNGVYRSLDGGESWEHMGLSDTRFIHRIAIHPENPNIVFVAAPGHRWGPNEERGLYRTLDGGLTWEKVLYVNEDTGVVEVAMEDNGRILYAAAYQRRRHAWGNLTGGPHSAIYRSMDGGTTWEKLGGGLPDGVLGKIAIAIAKGSPNVVYAAIGDSDGGLYRSEDRGETWERVNDIRTSYWYGNIYVDPVNENKVWIMGTQLDVSIDGGKTFENDWTARGIHVDHHALWINPKNTDHMLMGNDGGFHITYDGARTWSFLNNIPIAQFYVIDVDNRDPYHVYGGLQDNGTWGIPSRTYSRSGILNEDVVNVGGGDGFVPAIDPRDHTVVFAESQYGALRRVDLVTGRSSGIKPVPEDSTETYRFNWNSPVLISIHDPDVMYFGGNKLFRTTDKGESWEAISGDLTKNENPAEWEIMGLKPSLRAYNTITALAESTLRQGLIYTGADDGSVYRTSDGGETWESLSDRFDFGESPIDSIKFATKLHASPSDPETAYISFTGHYYDDFRPYLFRTTDAGDSWASIVGDLPAEAVVMAIVEHPENPDLLLAGIHNGLMISINGGRNWTRAGGNFPPVSVNDIRIKDGDLVLGTYGRGILIMDDIGFLEDLTEDVLDAEAHLFPVRETEQYYLNSRDLSNKAARFSGPNPEYGALITYYLKEGPPPSATSGEENPSEEAASTEESAESETPEVSIQVLDSDGEVVREMSGSDRQGFNRIAWDLRRMTDSTDSTGGSEGPQGARRRPQMTDVEPGQYTVKLTARGLEMVQTLTVAPDKRL
ncbi:MAG: hypothetical protein PVJ76_12565 [Gemmatimonadota bacterium]|jgi:photosystem II stability/assembly factor-like uncharacterized protein